MLPKSTDEARRAANVPLHLTKLNIFEEDFSSSFDDRADNNPSPHTHLVRQVNGGSVLDVGIRRTFPIIIIIYPPDRGCP